MALLSQLIDGKTQHELIRKKIGYQFRTLKQGVKKMRLADIKISKGKLKSVKFFGEKEKYVPKIKNKEVLMVKKGDLPKEMTVEEFLETYKH